MAGFGGGGEGASAVGAVDNGCGGPAIGGGGGCGGGGDSPPQAAAAQVNTTSVASVFVRIVSLAHFFLFLAVASTAGAFSAATGFSPGCFMAPVCCIISMRLV
jgi:hypothetical protein